MRAVGYILFIAMCAAMTAAAVIGQGEQWGMWAAIYGTAGVVAVFLLSQGSSH
jgi:hypothetical protein